jgi:hypothetical protein
MYVPVALDTWSMSGKSFETGSVWRIRKKVVLVIAGITIVVEAWRKVVLALGKVSVLDPLIVVVP